ncbi:MAG: hypothetical protein WBF31_02975, partial [Anaerolineae bacterium]
MAHGPANVLTALTRQPRAGRLRRLPANAPAGRGTPDGFLPVRRNANRQPPGPPTPSISPES